MRETNRLLAERKGRMAAVSSCWERTVSASGLSDAELGRVRDSVVDPLPTLEEFVVASLRGRAAGGGGGDTAGLAGGGAAGLARRLSAARLGDGACGSGRGNPTDSPGEAGLDALLSLGPAAAARAQAAAGELPRQPGGASGGEGPPVDIRWVLRTQDDGAAGQGAGASGQGSGGAFGPDPWLKRREAAGGHKVYVAPGRAAKLGPQGGRASAAAGAARSAGLESPAPEDAAMPGRKGGSVALSAAEEIDRCVLYRTTLRRRGHSSPT